MSSKLDDWRASRLLHRANLQGFARLPGCSIFDSSGAASASKSLPDVILGESERLVFSVENRDGGRLLVSTRQLIWLHGGKVQSLDLFAVKNRATAQIGTESITKDEVSAIVFGDDFQVSHFDSPKVVFALINILRVFPLTADYELQN